MKPGPNNVILVGFMGTGKTCVGEALARRLRYTYVDTDDLIEERAGKTISRIFDEDGEGHFRALESQIAADLEGFLEHVIATGGGIIKSDDNIAALKRAGLVVCLTARPEVIYERVKDETHRPLLQVADPAGRIVALLAERRAQYEKSGYQLDTSDLTPEEVVDHIVALVRR